jgi:hypothetical protein
MAISEKQLETWAKQGSVTQSASTYASIKGVLEDSTSPYYLKSFESFLQGSYGNDTNVYAESDVDIVMLLTSTFYTDISQMTSAEQAAYNAQRSSASYSHAEFKAAVASWLTKKYGNTVQAGNKAIRIPANGARRDADVLVASEFRRYTSFTSTSANKYHGGICFWLPDGTRVENFPKQHSANCTTKHQNTSSMFKPMVRIWKNLRNRMVADGKITKGLAPSYFVEGMLWNVPPSSFVNSYADTFINCLNWVQASDKAKLTTASGLHWLVRDGSPTCWPTKDVTSFLSAVKSTWTNWS